MPKKRNIYIMYALSFLQGMVFYGPIATLYRKNEGVSVFEITIIESISLLLCILLELPWGIVADKIGYKKTMIVCCGLYFVSKIVFWQAIGFVMFLAERLLLAVVMAGLSGVDTSIIYLSCEKKHTQKAFGIYNNLSTVGLLAAAAVYSLFIGDNFRLAGFLTVISYGAAFLLSLFLTEVKGSARHSASPREFIAMLRKILSNKPLIVFLLSVALINEAHQTVTVFLSQLQYLSCEMTNAEIGFAYIFVTLTGLIGVFSSRLTRLFGKKAFSAVLYIAAALSCITMAFTRLWWLSVFSIVVLRVCFSLFQPLQTALQHQSVSVANRATALSINAVILDGTAAFTNVLFGKISEINLSYAMLFGAVICLSGLVGFMLAVPKMLKPTGGEPNTVL